MIAKYCKRTHPVVSQWRSGQSHSWKALCAFGKKVELNIEWLPREGNISFWCDNWSKQGPLYKLLPSGMKPKDVQLKDVSEGGNWKYDPIIETYQTQSRI